MNNISVIGKILNINEKKYSITGFSEPREGVLEFTVRSRGLYCTCPKCLNHTNKRQDLSLYRQKTNLKHMNFSDGRIVELALYKRYFRCSHCAHQFFEKFEFESGHGFHTKAFENYVIASWGYMSGNMIAKVSKTSARKIYEILQHIDIT